MDILFVPVFRRLPAGHEPLGCRRDNAAPVRLVAARRRRHNDSPHLSRDPSYRPDVSTGRSPPPQPPRTERARRLSHSLPAASMMSALAPWMKAKPPAIMP